MYTYKAKVIKVYDGDTITVEIDLGFKINFTEVIRLYGIDTPEIRGEEREQGLISKNRLQDLILGKEIILNTIKDRKGKYGRYLGIIFLDDVNINELLVQENLAERYN